MPLVEELKSYGHTLSSDVLNIAQGQSIVDDLFNRIKDSDVILVCITKSSINSQAVMSEIITAKSFVEQSGGKKLIISIISGDVKIPDILQDLLFINFEGKTYGEIANTINKNIAIFVGRREAIEQKEEIKRESIEKKASDFIDPTLTTLYRREARNNIVAICCYIVGFLALILGIYFTIGGLKTLNTISEANYIILVILILKSIIIVGLLIACSKYAFTLGKAYMNEALRNADRFHAISFGRFYLQAFPDRANTFEEIKTMFQNWNIDKESPLEKLDTDSFDPKFVDKLLDLAKDLGDKIKK